MLTFISYIVLVSICLTLAWLAISHSEEEAVHDAEQFRNYSFHQGVFQARRLELDENGELNHAEALQERVIVMGVFYGVALLVALLADWFLPISFRMFAVGLAMVLWGTWTYHFRRNLNKERGLPWYYMDDMDEGGNNYDEFWWMLRLFFRSGSFRRITQEEWNELVKSGVAESYQKQVATMATTFEITIAMLGALLVGSSVGE